MFEFKRFLDFINDEEMGLIYGGDYSEELVARIKESRDNLLLKQMSEEATEQCYISIYFRNNKFLEMKIQKKQIYALLIQIFCLICLYFTRIFNIGYSIKQVTTMQSIGFIALLVFLLLFGTLLFINKDLNYFHIFLCLCFLFSFGQSFVALFTGSVNEQKLLSVGNGVLSSEAIYNSSFYILNAIVFLVMGYTFFIKPSRVESTKRTNNFKITRFNQIGWFFFLLSIIPTFYLLIQDIITLNTSGYMDTLKVYVGVNKVFSILAGFFSSGFIIVFLTEKRYKFKTFAVVLMAGYMLLQMLGGSRIVVFRFAVLFLTMFLIKHRRISLKFVILIFLICLGMGFAFALVSSMRNFGGQINSFNDFWNRTIAEFRGENIFYKIFFEAGNTQIINTIVYSSCPEKIGYCYGASLVKMMLSVVPNIGIWEINPTTITTDSTFSPLFTNLCGLGSSIFAESYWNFGEAGAYVFMFLFGAILAKIIYKLFDSINNGNKILQYVLYYILFYLVFLVRSDMIEFGRSFIYYCLVPVIILNVSKSNEKRKVGTKYGNRAVNNNCNLPKH